MIIWRLTNKLQQVRMPIYKDEPGFISGSMIEVERMDYSNHLKALYFFLQAGTEVLSIQRF